MILRHLTTADVPACLALAADREWPPDEGRWRFLLEVGTGYGIEDPSGELVGSTILTRYGDRQAVISMVLVASRAGRQGLGRRLMERALADAGDRIVTLNATEYGRPLYERLGFAVTGEIVTHWGTVPPVPPGASRPAGPGDLAAVLALDAAVTGVDRSAMITSLFRFVERLRVVERKGEIIGYAGAWRSGETLVVGPVLAEDEAMATDLVAGVVAGVSGPVRLDLDPRHAGLTSWARERGLATRMSVSAMVHGGRTLPGDRSRLFVPVMQALG